MSELRACPFCGSEGVRETPICVKCDQCSAWGPYDDGNRDALWNRRAEQPSGEREQFRRDLIKHGFGGLCTYCGAPGEDEMALMAERAARLTEMEFGSKEE